jgi:hypothetical protein
LGRQSRREVVVPVVDAIDVLELGVKRSLAAKRSTPSVAKFVLAVRRMAWTVVRPMPSISIHNYWQRNGTPFGAGHLRGRPMPFLGANQLDLKCVARVCSAALCLNSGPPGCRIAI